MSVSCTVFHVHVSTFVVNKYLRINELKIFITADVKMVLYYVCITEHELLVCCVCVIVI